MLVGTVASSSLFLPFQLRLEGLALALQRLCDHDHRNDDGHDSCDDSGAESVEEDAFPPCGVVCEMCRWLHPPEDRPDTQGRPGLRADTRLPADEPDACYGAQACTR